MKQKVDRQLNYKKYEEALSRELKEQATATGIRSKDHQMYSMIRQTKLALSNYDDKRYWLNDCEGLPYGGCSIEG